MSEQNKAAHAGEHEGGQGEAGNNLKSQYSTLLFGYYDNHDTKAPARMISVLELAEMAANPSTTKHPHIAAFAQHNGMAKTKDAAQLAQFAMIVTDHDDDDKTRQQIEQLYDVLGAPYLAFTTSSHLLSQNKGGKPVTPSRKWKVVIPLADAVDAETFSWISQGITQSLCTDTAQTRITQIAYVPNVIAKGNPYEFINKLGDPFEWLHPDDDCDFMVEARTGWQEVQRRETVEVKAKPKPRPTMAGEKAGIVEKTIDYYSGDTGAVIAARGFKWKGRKYLSPFSSSGTAGVSILEDGGKQYVYSHHSASDPLSAHNHDGHRLDLFDVLVALDHGGDFEAAIKHYAPIVDPDGQKQRQIDHAKAKSEDEAVAKFHEIFSSTESEELAKPKTSKANNSEFDLPPLPVELLSLPDGLGAIQQYIYGTMTYPCLATAGWAAIATFTAFAQTNITIDSRQGLGLNEFYLTLAKTGFGKEALRYPLNKLVKVLNAGSDFDFNVEDIQSGPAAANLPNIDSAAPSSKQGLHLQLEANRSVYIQSDEFAEWLKLAVSDTHKAAALAYAMEIYNRAFGTIHPGGAATHKYEQVDNPRLSVFATTTAESVLSSMTLAHAEMGAYNRFVIFVAPDQMPEKKYTGQVYDPSKAAIDAASYPARLRKTHMTITPCGFKAFIDNDKNLAEPIKFKDGLMGGRLSEQAIKMAGLFALSAKRTEITGADMELAYKIRLGLYYRASAMIEQSGAISGAHETTKALDQIRRLLQSNKSIYISALKTRSRAYQALHINEQNAVIRTLIDQGDAVYHPESRKILVAAK